jgi:hypothetical protein
MIATVGVCRCPDGTDVLKRPFTEIMNDTRTAARLVRLVGRTEGLISLGMTQKPSP